MSINVKRICVKNTGFNKIFAIFPNILGSLDGSFVFHAKKNLTNSTFDTVREVRIVMYLLSRFFCFIFLSHHKCAKYLVVLFGSLSFLNISSVSFIRLGSKLFHFRCLLTAPCIFFHNAPCLLFAFNIQRLHEKYTVIHVFCVRSCCY